MDDRTKKPTSLAKIARITQRDGSTLGELIYQLAKDGHVVIDDGIVKAAH